MGILIGMDEAGYGPNLGPLVVAATAWQVEEEGAGDGRQGTGKKNRRRAANNLGSTLLASAARPNLRQHDLYDRLRRVVCNSASDKKVAIADSKSLYKPGHGLRQLERGIHAVLAALDRPATCWTDAVQSCAADPQGHHRQLCWHESFDCGLPLNATAEELSPLGPQLTAACAESGVRPLVIRARYVFPAEFNDLTERYGTKGAALSHITIGLLREVIDGIDAINVPIYTLCDKHGGRNFYAALLQHHFSEHWIEPICEGGEESRYAWGSDDARVEVAFRVRGEGFLPTALASMTAKYFRELAMRAFNEFWCARVPGLRPTAGYPKDAPRFKREIAAAQHTLGIDDYVLWRNR